MYLDEIALSEGGHSVGILPDEDELTAVILNPKICSKRNCRGHCGASDCRAYDTGK
jgi:hypothetical protein